MGEHRYPLHSKKSESLLRGPLASVLGVDCRKVMTLALASHKSFL